MGQNNQKDQKGPKMTAAVMLVQNNQNNQKIWSPHISHTILKVRFFWDTLYNVCTIFVFCDRRKFHKSDQKHSFQNLANTGLSESWLLKDKTTEIVQLSFTGELL